MPTYLIRNLAITIDQIECPENTQCVPPITQCPTPTTYFLVGRDKEKFIGLLESALEELKKADEEGDD